MGKLRTAVVGCGLIGTRRAEEAAKNPHSTCSVVVDADRSRAETLAAKVGARVEIDWHRAVAAGDVDVLCVATPNGYLAEIAIAALGAGKHVLIEKPMGRSVEEALRIAEAAEQSKRLFKVGFNHRYHPAIARARSELGAGTIGKAINARARYGHGGRPGYEREWRGDVQLSGGGELTDQGVHLADLMHMFLGVPSEVYGVVQTAVWPLGDLEDNGFGLLRFPDGVIAQFHSSWTQWKNLFSFELFGETGSLVVEGLGRSYGVESLTIARRAMQGGVPAIERIEYDGEDISWRDEWAEFASAILEGTDYMGNARDGVVAMKILSALYRSAAENQPTRL